MSFTATACCLYPISVPEVTPISRFTVRNCNDTRTYLAVTIQNWRPLCTILNTHQPVAKLGGHTAPCLLLVSSTDTDVLVSSSAAFCCGAWLPARLMERSFSTIESSGLSSWSTKLSWTTLLKIWKTRLQRLQIPSLKKVRKRPLSDHTE